VALSRRMPAGVTLLRGAEGDYAQWSKAHGGAYVVDHDRRGAIVLRQKSGRVSWCSRGGEGKEAEGSKMAEQQRKF
jgi:hypothetical protein